LNYPHINVSTVMANPAQFSRDYAHICTLAAVHVQSKRAAVDEGLANRSLADLYMLYVAFMRVIGSSHTNSEYSASVQASTYMPCDDDQLFINALAYKIVTMMTN
jgi:hypothetical protein